MVLLLKDHVLCALAPDVPVCISTVIKQQGQEMALKIVKKQQDKDAESLQANVVMTKYGFVYDQRKLKIEK